MGGMCPSLAYLRRQVAKQMAYSSCGAGEFVDTTLGLQEHGGWARCHHPFQTEHFVIQQAEFSQFCSCLPPPFPGPKASSLEVAFYRSDD